MPDEQFQADGIQLTRSSSLVMLTNTPKGAYRHLTYRFQREC